MQHRSVCASYSSSSKALLSIVSTANVEKPHINLLHVTPMMKNPTNELQKESYYVKLKYQNGTYVLDTSNHQYLPKTGTLIGAKFWNEETREFVLGKEGLRLSIVKPVGKGAPEEHEMRQVFLYSGIGDEMDIDSGRVYLGMKLTAGMNQEVIFCRKSSFLMGGKNQREDLN